MLFTIIESFSTDDGDRWVNYCNWRGLNFTRFDSIDGILRPKLFTTPIGEDWTHIVNDNCKLHLITDYAYAVKKYAEIGMGDLVGVRLDGHDENHPRFLGFDLIDQFFDISLLTNWGNDVEIINQALSDSALVKNYQLVRQIQDELLRAHPDDSHVEACQIVSIYRPH